MTINFPVLGYEHGDITAFMSPESLIKYIEPIDVKNGEYEFFDANGFELEARVVYCRDAGSSRFRRLASRKTSATITLSDESAQSNPERLHMLIVDFLLRIGVESPLVEGTTLAAAVALLIQKGNVIE